MSMIFQDGSYTQTISPGRRRQGTAQPAAPQSQGSPWGDALPYRPGMAQPIQPPSQGTPYGQPSPWGGDGRQREQQPRNDFSPWRDGQSMGRGQIHQMTYGRPFGVPAGTVEAQPQQYSSPGGPAAFTPGMAQARPPQSTGTPYGMAAPARPPFSSTMYDGFGNQTTPEQFYPQQQAMVSQIFGRLGQMDSGTYLGPGSPPPTWGRIPEFNYGEMWDQAGQMVQQGWQNPMQAPQQAWRQQHQTQIASQPNQNWLRSLSPANRSVYGLLQGLF